MLQIGPYALSAPLALAPMAGVTDRPFRLLCRRLGAGVAASEMLTADTRLWHTAKSRLRMTHEDEPEPRVVQIAGAEPEMLAEAARLNVDAGAQIIDINMGCPAKKVCNKAAGSALMRDESLVTRILERVVHAVNVPVTLKIRTGWCPEHRNGVTIAKIAEASGVLALAVHGRTRACMFRGSAEYETVRAIKDAVRIPVFANGDIDSPQKAREIFQATGVDGVMIGRGAQGRPWIFREVNFFLATGRAHVPVALQEVRDILLAHLKALYSHYGADTGVRVARKHLSWYCQHHSEAGEFRKRVMTATTTDEQFAMAREYFGQLASGISLAA
ncbi:MAG TPA: tRNA dihydrouridine synthase DusB [Steroidobacteraceae bacterium]|nr:tRNA dihydrouridine synthase DusB [Steroidobacteraceae bacterium]